MTTKPRNQPADDETLRLIYTLQALRVPLADQAADTIRALKARVHLLEAQIELLQPTFNRRLGD